MELIYRNFTRETLDGQGRLTAIEFDPPENFNFGFDVVDALARKCPDKTAMIHLSNDKQERRFTFSQISRYSNRAANFFSSLGIGKGDVVIDFSSPAAVEKALPYCEAHKLPIVVCTTGLSEELQL